jgi:hypothetical protein
MARSREVGENSGHERGGEREREKEETNCKM